MATNLELFAEEVHATIKAVGDRLLARIVALEQRQPVNGKDGAKGEKGDPGESIDPLFVQRLMDRIETLEARQPIHGTNGIDGKDGKDADESLVKALQERVSLLGQKLAEFSEACYERTLDIETVTGNVVAQMRSPWPAPVNGKDGTSVTVDDVRPVIEEAVQKTLAAWPAPKDGKDGAPGGIGPQGERGPQGEPGRDGRDGMQGLTGLQGEKGDRGIDGINGKDGADGINGKDSVMENIAVKWTSATSGYFVRKDDLSPIEGGEFVIPSIRYQGVWKSGETYAAGDNVTHAGSLWMCLQHGTTEKPGDAQGGKYWQLAVKRGMDGREGKQGPQGPSGPKGDKGDPGRIYS